jgi:hypothetical protein
VGVRVFDPHDSVAAPSAALRALAAGTASAKPWIDVYGEFGVIPGSFPAIDVVK